MTPSTLTLIVVVFAPLIAANAAATSTATPTIKKQIFCSTGFAVHVNLDCYPNIVHVLKAEKGVLSGGEPGAELPCDPKYATGRTEPLKSSICRNEASPTCNNAFGLAKPRFVYVVYQCVEHISVCGGSMNSPPKVDGFFHAGTTEMSPLIGHVGVIYSPLYKGEHGKIPESADCSLILKLPRDSQLTLSLKDFHLPQSHNCKTSSLSVFQTKGDVDGGGGPSSKAWLRKWHRCGIWNKGVLYSSGEGVSAIKIAFVTYPRHKDDPATRGFVLRYNVTRREELTTTRRTTAGTIASSASPSPYSPKKNPTAAKWTNSPPNGTSPQNSFDQTSLPVHENKPDYNQTIVTRDSFGMTEIVICVSAAGGVVLILVGVAALVCARRHHKDQIFQRNVSRRYSRDDGRDHHRRNRASSSTVGRDALLQPYYMGSPNDSGSLTRSHKSLMRPSTALSQYPIFAGDEWAQESTPVTDVSYSTPTYNYQGIPTTEL